MSALGHLRREYVYLRAALDHLVEARSEMEELGPVDGPLLDIYMKIDATITAMRSELGERS